MRYPLIILCALLAVGCTRRDTRKVDAQLAVVNAKANEAGHKAGVALKKGYEEAKPELKRAGHKAGAELHHAGTQLKSQVHEATAPSDGDRDRR